MANTIQQTFNETVNRFRSAKGAKEARPYIAEAIDLCYSYAILRAGGAQGGITASMVYDHSDRVRNAIFGEEVRDAIKAGINLCYAARGIMPSTNELSIQKNLIETQKGKDLKAAIFNYLTTCFHELR